MHLEEIEDVADLDKDKHAEYEPTGRNCISVLVNLSMNGRSLFVVGSLYYCISRRWIVATGYTRYYPEYEPMKLYRLPKYTEEN